MFISLCLLSGQEPCSSTLDCRITPKLTSTWAAVCTHQAETHTLHPSMSFPSSIPPHLSHSFSLSLFIPTLSHLSSLFPSFPFLLGSSTPNALLSHNDQVTWHHPIRSSLTTQMIGSESSYGSSPSSSSSSPREVTLWMGARHQRKEALQIFAREVAPAGTGMG